MFCFQFFSVCMYINEEPSGLVLKFKQNGMDDFSLVLLMLQNLSSNSESWKNC